MSKNTNKGSVSNYVIWIIVIAIVVVGYLFLSTKGGSNTVSVKDMTGTVEVGQTQKVSWTPTSLVGETVSVNLIKKVSDNPATYSLVRTIAAQKTNDGFATWVPAATDVGTGLSVEIGCTTGISACSAVDNFTGGLAVVDTGRFANTAAAYQAIEALGNK